MPAPAEAPALTATSGKVGFRQASPLRPVDGPFEPLYFEEASFLKLGLCYEQNARFSGGVYQSFVRRLSDFSPESLAKSLQVHERHAVMLLELDQKVAGVVQKLKAKGFVSPYLKAFVVARSNPLRFMKEPPELEDLMATIRGKVERFKVDRIKQEDIVASGGGPPDEE